MKKWLRFFCLSFFSDKTSKEGAKRGYTSFVLGLILAFAFLWVAYVGADILPLTTHYDNSPEFKQTVQDLFANPELDKRITAEIKDGVLSANILGKEQDSVYINTLENDTDKRNYSNNGYSVVVDLRAADTLAEFEAYYVSNDGKALTISYEEYLTLSEVARLNFDFKLRYTGKELLLNDELIESYKAYLYNLGGDSELSCEGLASKLDRGEITKDEYARAIYELYFQNYYPEITAYESTSLVPLLRNYYYHQYISQGLDKYLFIFDDYMTASFETRGGIDVSFYGFYDNMEDGVIVSEGATQSEADEMADAFIKESIRSITPLTAYAYAMNVFSLIPFIALMPFVVTLLAYSVLKLGGIGSVTSFGATFRILGSYVWFSSVVSTALTLALSFFLQPNIITSLPLVIFFLTLVVRSMIFSVREVRAHLKQSEQEEKVSTEA